MFHSNRRIRSADILFCSLLLLIGRPGMVSANIPYLTRFHPETGATFEFADHIDFPAYSWPRTLLSNIVDFTGAGIGPEDMVLVNLQTEEAVPFQLSEMVFDDENLVRATVNFFSDLPSGAERQFVLQPRTAGTPRAESPSPRVEASRSEELIELDNGIIGISIPAGRQESENGVTGPLAAMTRGDRNLGTSYLRTGDLEVTDVETKIIDSGALFAMVEVRYRFSNGGTYKARMKVVAGYKHIEFEEEIVGLTEADGVSLEMEWNGFNPERRFAANSIFHNGRAIDDPVVTAAILEDPHWNPGWREETSEKMVLRLLPFQGNAVGETSYFVSFLEEDGKEKDGLELGLFVLDHQKWQDYEYKVWQHSTKLQVKFRYTDDVLYWMWPLAEGTRSTGLGPVRLAAEEEEWLQVRRMHKFHGLLSLNHVKNWVLTYPDSADQPHAIFKDDHIKTRTPDKFEEYLFDSVLTRYAEWMGQGLSIAHRIVYSVVVPQYTELVEAFTPEQKKRIDALLLFAGYVMMGEEVAPIRNAVAGCPNMAADGWAVPAQIAFLFPQHPMAGEWLDYYERTWDITHRKYTRPEVPAYESLGGRWTESFATYNWAHLRPTGHSQIAGILTDGKNRWPTPEAALRGRWMVDMLTAPIYNPNPYWRQTFGPRRSQPAPLSPDWQPGMPFRLELGFTRQYPAHGGHGSGTAMAVPQIVEFYGQFMRHYQPMLAEHILWAAHQGNVRDNHFESRAPDPWKEKMFSVYPENTGTNPHLRSVKYTGHGIVLRSGVDTPEELSIHLDQVDRGPNYRWGLGGENASGSIYFFANGRPYAGHERESAGDRGLDATDGVTTFGVMKDGSYRSIGMNVLEKPLYDLGIAQFTEVTSRDGESAYSWPEYQARSIMLVGSDYWLLTDRIRSDWRFRARFTWFTARDLDFPKLIFLNPQQIRQDHWTEIQTPMSKGFHRDFSSQRDFLHTVLVTHKDAVTPSHMSAAEVPFLTSTPIKQYRRARGFDTPDGAWRLQAGHSQDIVFRSLDSVNYENEDGDKFEGTAGVIRHRDDGAVEMAMFHSRMMAVAELSVKVDREDIGVGCRIENGRAEGVFMAPQAGSITLASSDIHNKTLYIDSRAVEVVRTDDSITAALPSGRHYWQLVAGPPRPARPVIQSTEYLREGIRVAFSEAAGAREYLIEISRNGGASWEERAVTAETSILLTSLEQGKYHVRVTARNGELTGPSAHEWPIYVTEEPPHHPEGLALRITENGAEVSWGRVLGVTEYLLYRRETGTDAYERIYSGRDPSFTDVPPESLTPPYPLPGMARNAHRPEVPVYEYAVSAVNGFGEGRKSHPVSTDPANWLVWQPAGPLGFSRRTAFWEPPYVPARMVPPEDYPRKEP